MRKKDLRRSPPRNFRLEEEAFMQKVRIGFVGLGGICRERHVPGLRRIDNVEIVAVSNRSRASSEAAAREFNVPIVCDTWQELIRRDDVDAVFIGTWPYMHREVSVAALEAGRHVFCQARMAMDFLDAKQMYDCATRAGRVAMLCPVPYGLSVDATVARLLREEFLGEVRLVRVQSFSSAYTDPNAPMNWRKDHRFSGLNTLTLGMFIELMHRWFGWTKSVSAHSDIFTPERIDAAGQRIKVRVPDQILFHTEMEAGFPIQYVFSGVVHAAGGFQETSYLLGKDMVEIYGSKANLQYDVAADTLYGAQAREAPTPVPIAPEDAYDVRNWLVEQDFIRAIRHGTEYHPNFEDGLRYMQVIQAVFDSAASARRIELQELSA